MGAAARLTVDPPSACSRASLAAVRETARIRLVAYERSPARRRREHECDRAGAMRTPWARRAEGASPAPTRRTAPSTPMRSRIVVHARGPVTPQSVTPACWPLRTQCTHVAGSDLVAASTRERKRVKRFDQRKSSSRRGTPRNRALEADRRPRAGTRRFAERSLSPLSRRRVTRPTATWPLRYLNAGGRGGLESMEVRAEFLRNDLLLRRPWRPLVDLRAPSETGDQVRGYV